MNQYFLVFISVRPVGTWTMLTVFSTATPTASQALRRAASLWPTSCQTRIMSTVLETLDPVATLPGVMELIHMTRESDTHHLLITA